MLGNALFHGPGRWDTLLRHLCGRSEILPRAVECLQAAAAVSPRHGDATPSAFLTTLMQLLAAAPASAAANPSLLNPQIELVLHALRNPGAQQRGAVRLPDERQVSPMPNISCAANSNPKPRSAAWALAQIQTYRLRTNILTCLSQRSPPGT